MKEFRIGDKVVVMDISGCIVYSKVVIFLDIKFNIFGEYIFIQMRNFVVEVIIMEQYLIYQLNKYLLLELVCFVWDLRVGDFVYI